jgi:hypothetical protein
MPLILIALVLLPLPVRAGEKEDRHNRATLVVEYGLDSLERRYYHPSFRFDFPFRGGNFFSQVEYHSRMNGDLQGVIDYWVNVGVQKQLRDRLKLELRLNHFCRHRTVLNTAYIWNLNELLGRVALDGKDLSLALGAGVFTGGSDDERYRQLATAEAQWRGFLIPEFSLYAELKLVNFSRLYHDLGFSFALNRSVEIFFKHIRHYHFHDLSYLGLRFRSGNGEGDGAFLDTMRVLAGVSPYDRKFKMELEGEFRLEFFRNDSRRVVVGVDFETPILNGEGFFAQFWPAKMIYDLSLDYEKKITPDLFAVWVSLYRLDMPVDDNQPFAASLFTGLALRNQPDFDVLNRDVRYEVTAGYDFKHGLEAAGKLGVLIWKNRFFNLFTEMRARIGAETLRLDCRLQGSFGRAVQLRPYVGWKMAFDAGSDRNSPSKLLFGLGFFKKF